MYLSGIIDPYKLFLYFIRASVISHKGLTPLQKNTTIQHPKSVTSESVTCV